MKKNGKLLDVVIDEGAEHAFFNDTRVTYDVDAARDSVVRTLSFLRQNVVQRREHVATPLRPTRAAHRQGCGRAARRPGAA